MYRMAEWFFFDNYIGVLIHEVAHVNVLEVPATFVSQSLCSLYDSKYDWMPSTPRNGRNNVIISIFLNASHWLCAAIYMSEKVDGLLYWGIAIRDRKSVV